MRPRRSGGRRVAGTPGPEPGVYPIDTGTAEMVRDRDRPTGFMLFVNGVESSHADLADPAWLEFEYLRWMATVITDRFADSNFDVVHLGAAGCSLARQLIATRPGSRHLAVEVDARLAALVREWFDLPRAPALRIRVGDARAVTESLAPHSADVIVRDVFAGALTPDGLTTLEFAQLVARTLRPGGLFLANCADGPDLMLTRAELVTLGTVFPQLAAVADAPMLKGRRRGNVVLAAGHRPIGGPALIGDLLGGPAPAQLWDDRHCRAVAGGIRVRRDPPPVGPGDPITAG